MAVASVAVEMGPRNKRRVTAAAASSVAVVGVAVLFVLLRPSSGSGPPSSSGSTRANAPTFVTQKIVYGMTSAEVLRRIGKPSKTVGACWQYDENEKIREGQNFLNAERVCFLSGIYSYDYSEIDGKWYYPTDSIKLPHPVG